MNKKYIYLILFISVSFVSFSQNIYENKLEGCDTKQFALESQNITAKINSDKLNLFIQENILEGRNNKLKGILKLQIIVYIDGSSCLLSYENNTNIELLDSDIEKIKNQIDTKLIWNNGIENVAALLEIKFKNKTFVIKRYGMDGISGWHELKI